MPDAPFSFWIGFHALLFAILAAAGAIAFAATLYFGLNARLGTEFLAGYALEESLSIDNLFVFLLLFQTFRVEGPQQRRVLFWGILGAVAMRATFIVLGVHLLNRFEWISYIFAMILLVAAVRLVLPENVAKNTRPVWTKWLERWTPISESQSGFFVDEEVDGKQRRIPTVLLLTLIAIAFTDFVFALDSIPAVLSITRHTFVAYSSNIMAVMGLRSLYFVLAHLLQKLRYLHYGLATVLAFAAAKMLAAPWIEISATASLAAIFGILLLTSALSLRMQRTG